MDIGEESDPVEVPIPVHPDQVPLIEPLPVPEPEPVPGMTGQELTKQELLRERGHIGGCLGEWLAGKIIDHFGELPIGGDDFTPLYLEEVRELGYDDDDPAILLRRKSDGVVFEVEIDVNVLRVPSKAEQAETAGQLPLPGVPA